MGRTSCHRGLAWFLRCTVYRAILLRIKHPEAREPAAVHGARDVEIGPRCCARHAHRLVLPPRLIRRGTTDARLLFRLDAVFANEPGMVVIHFVIGPHHNPRPRRTRRLQIRIALVLGITSAIVVERANSQPVVRWHPSRVHSTPPFGVGSPMRREA